MWAFSDESERSNVMLVGIVLVPPSAVEGRLHPAYDHRPAQAEPLPWAADAVCWAAGDWRRRLGAVLAVRDIGA